MSNKEMATFYARRQEHGDGWEIIARVTTGAFGRVLLSPPYTLRVLATSKRKEFAFTLVYAARTRRDLLATSTTQDDLEEAFITLFEERLLDPDCSDRGLEWNEYVQALYDGTLLYDSSCDHMVEIWRDVIKRRASRGKQHTWIKNP